MATFGEDHHEPLQTLPAFSTDCQILEYLGQNTPRSYFVECHTEADCIAETWVFCGWEAEVQTVVTLPFPSFLHATWMQLTSLFTAKYRQLAISHFHQPSCHQHYNCNTTVNFETMCWSIEWGTHRLDYDTDLANYWTWYERQSPKYSLGHTSGKLWTHN